jgi:hypothetical protein
MNETKFNGILLSFNDAKIITKEFENILLSQVIGTIKPNMLLDGTAEFKYDFFDDHNPGILLVYRKIKKELPKEDHLGNSQNNNKKEVEIPMAKYRVGICMKCFKDSTPLYPFHDGMFCSECCGEMVRNLVPKEEKNNLGPDTKNTPEEFRIKKLDSKYRVKPDKPKIINSISAQFVCKCRLNSIYLHDGQVSKPCPVCGRQWKAKHNSKTGRFRFIHYNVWWRRLFYFVWRGQII